jgi:hypothetical protein
VNEEHSEDPLIIIQELKYKLEILVKDPLYLIYEGKRKRCRNYQNEKQNFGFKKTFTI